MSDDVTTDAPSSINDLSVAMALTGKVKRIELYGAFVDIGIGQDALLHISALGKPNVRNVEDVVKVDEEITVYILKIDESNGRVALSLEKPPEVNMKEISVGDTYTGKVVRIENFGVFVDIGAERPGMVHVSELTDGFVKSPSDVVSVDQEVQVRVLKVNNRQKKIDLSMREPEETYQIEEEEDEELPTAMAMAFRRAMDGQEDDVEFSPAPAPRNNRRNKRDKRNKGDQDDIISRTLRSQQDN